MDLILPFEQTTGHLHYFRYTFQVRLFCRLAHSRMLLKSSGLGPRWAFRRPDSRRVAQSSPPEGALHWFLESDWRTSIRPARGILSTELAFLRNVSRAHGVERPKTARNSRPSYTMPMTTSTNTTTQSVLHVLADYDLHHSGDPQDPAEPEPPNRKATPKVENPSGWDTEHRRVPPYRPINRNLDMDMRPGGTNVAEAIFIATMLNGVQLTAVSCIRSLS